MLKEKYWSKAFRMANNAFYYIPVAVRTGLANFCILDVPFGVKSGDACVNAAPSRGSAHTHQNVCSTKAPT